MTPNHDETDGPNRRVDTTRARMNAPVSVVIYDEHDKRVAAGTANLKNLSLQGALISDLSLGDGVELDPKAKYTLRFQLMAGPLAGMAAVCQSVRFDPTHRSFGVHLPEGFKLPIM